MNNDNISSPLVANGVTYLNRVLRHEALKKGTAAFIASALFAIASEALFPTNDT